MRILRKVRCHRLVAVVSSLLISAMAVPAGATTLNMARAELLGLENDPSIESVRSRQAALGELEVSAAQLPDPVLKFGVMSLPTDSFRLGQEAMTQVQVGVMQKFPRGDTRELRAGQIREQSESLAQSSRDLALRLRLSVREEYLEVWKQQRLAQINLAAEEAFRDLEEITLEYYATGQVQQQDALRAALEVAKVRERSARISEAEEIARGRLATWLGDHAWQDLEPEKPLLAEPQPVGVIRDNLPNHPRLLALHQQVLAAEKGVELAEQRHKPEFGVDLTYGGRRGDNPDGSGRSDLLSVMVQMDLPLFSGKRQDRVTAASLARSAAVAFDRDDLHRRLRSDIEVNARSLQKQRERLLLFEQSLLPEAEYNAEATLQAYQAAVEDLTTLMRARITEFDLQLEYVRLQAETLKTQARLLYLEGRES